MSIMRRILKSNITLGNTFRNTTAPAKLNTIGEDGIYKWVSTLSNNATTPEAKASVAQLSNLVNYFNRKSESTVQV
jgi:hypothetical protein